MLHGWGRIYAFTARRRMTPIIVSMLFVLIAGFSSLPALAYGLFNWHWLIVSLGHLGLILFVMGMIYRGHACRIDMCCCIRSAAAPADLLRLRAAIVSHGPHYVARNGVHRASHRAEFKLAHHALCRRTRFAEHGLRRGHRCRHDHVAHDWSCRWSLHSTGNLRCDVIAGLVDRKPALDRRDPLKHRDWHERSAPRTAPGSRRDLVAITAHFATLRILPQSSVMTVPSARRYICTHNRPSRDETSCARLLSRHGREVVDVQIALIAKSHAIIAVHRVPRCGAGGGDLDDFERDRRSSLRHAWCDALRLREVPRRRRCASKLAATRV